MELLLQMHYVQRVLNDKGLAKYMSIAGIGAGLLLSIIYVILGYVGQLVAH